MNKWTISKPWKPWKEDGKWATTLFKNGLVFYTFWDKDKTNSRLDAEHFLKELTKDA